MLRREAHVAGNLFHSQLNTKTHKDSVSTDIAVLQMLIPSREIGLSRSFRYLITKMKGIFKIQMLIDKGSVSAVSSDNIAFVFAILYLLCYLSLV